YIILIERAAEFVSFILSRQGVCMSYPSNFYYHEQHAWLLMDGADEALIGITHFAQDTLGDVVELDCPEQGAQILKGVPCGTIESRKTVSDLVSPVFGVVVEVNHHLVAEPYLINDDPYGRGWVARIKLADPGEVDELMRAEQYRQFVGD